MQSEVKQMGGGFTMIFTLVLLGGMMFFMTRSQKKQQQERQKQLNAMKTGDSVVTIGGLHGVLSEINEKTVLIDCEGIVLEFDRAAIRIVTPGTAVTNDSAVTSVPVTEVEETVTEEVTEVPETSDPSKEKKD
ncbi:preprotein translocase subunit YajC [Enterococcus faecalis]|nr:preprotein translocase subunit YajC [Enterococcus faecalis]